MPVLSALPNAPQPLDDSVRPVTTLIDPHIPDYALTFDIASHYSGTDFAFDRCLGRNHLLPGNLVDEDFLLCRYERLFAVDASKKLYYLVPWMAVPGKKSGTDTYLLDESIFVLSVNTFPPSLLTAAAGNRRVRLVPSNSITAIWASKQNATVDKDILDIPNLKQFLGDTVEILIPDGQYPAGRAQIEIVDTADNKVVGKVNILFLEKLVVNAFLFKVTELNDRFEFRRMAVPEIPDSLESTGAPGYTHGSIVDDANLYGFRQIGVELKIDNGAIDIYETGGLKMEIASGSVMPPTVLKSEIGLTSGTTISTLVKYLALCQKFLDRIAYLMDGAQKCSAYSAVYLFVVPLELFGDDKPASGDLLGVSYPVSFFSPGEGATRDTAEWTSGLAPNVGLFNTTATAPTRNPAWRTDLDLAGRSYEYKTLVHEFSHAMLLNHYFDGEPTKSAATIPPLSELHAIVDASQRLRLYLLNDYVKDMAAAYDEKKICMTDFKTNAVIRGGDETLFDQIVANGMDVAINGLITKLFPGGTHPTPAFWTKAADADMQLADLSLWISLNDLVKFNFVNGTTNIMDYDATSYYPGPAVSGSNPTRYEAYIAQTPVRFSRFQWELFRRTARRRLALTVTN